MKRNNPKKEERMTVFFLLGHFLLYIGYIGIIIMNNDPKKKKK
jgi:hypothetical protein